MRTIIVERLEDAVVASSISESKFFVNIVLLLVWFNNTQSPLKQIINHGDITSGLTEDNRIITINPVDYLCWSEKVAEAARFHDEVFKDIEADGKELWIVGQASDRAKLELTNLGWEVTVQASIEVDSFSEDKKKEEATKGVNKKALDVFQEGNKESGTQNNQ